MVGAGWAGLPLAVFGQRLERRARAPRARRGSAWSGQLELFRTDLTPATVVPCPPFNASMPVSSCVRKHAARLPSGRGRGAPKFPACASCSIGAGRQVLLAVIGWQPPPYQAFSTSRTEAARRAAYRAWLEGRGPRDELPTVDGLPPRSGQ